MNPEDSKSKKEDYTPPRQSQSQPSSRSQSPTNSKPQSPKFLANHEEERLTSLDLAASQSPIISQHSSNISSENSPKAASSPQKPTLKLAPKRGITTSISKTAVEKPALVVDFFGQASPVIAPHNGNLNGISSGTLDSANLTEKDLQDLENGITPGQPKQKTEDSTSVRVALRVRPFLEKEAKEKPCVR